MPNKSVEKHRQASKEGMARFRARQKALKAEAAGITAPSITDQPEVMPNVSGCETPEGRVQAVPDKYGSQDCKCLHCKQSKGRHKINHWARKPADELEKNEVNRVSLPGDVDYKGAADLLLLDAAHDA